MDPSPPNEEKTWRIWNGHYVPDDWEPPEHWIGYSGDIITGDPRWLRKEKEEKHGP